MTDDANSLEDLKMWLGPAAEALNGEQLEILHDACKDIENRYPDPDEVTEREAALSAAVQFLLGETTPADAAAELERARAAERVAFVHAEQVGVMLHRLQGERKATAAGRVGISRSALLAALGERVRPGKPKV
jgi:hypothetical protein